MALSMDKNQTDNAQQVNSNAPLPDLAKRFLWADDADSVQRVVLGLAALCVVLFLLDLIIHRHSYVPGEGLPGFYAIVGFVAFTLIVLGATQLRRLILRNENYYAPYSVDAESYPEEGTEQISHDDNVRKNDKGDSARVEQS